RTIMDSSLCGLAQQVQIPARPYPESLLLNKANPRSVEECEKLKYDWRECFLTFRSLPPRSVLDIDVSLTPAYSSLVFNYFVKDRQAKWNGRDSFSNLFLVAENTSTTKGSRIKTPAKALKIFHVVPVQPITGVDWNTVLCKPAAIAKISGINSFFIMPL
ncbi:unnamed protein product, partial [Oikopleura dioica]